MKISFEIVNTRIYPDAVTFFVEAYLDGITLNFLVSRDYCTHNSNRIKFIHALYAKDVVEMSRRIIEYERNAPKDSKRPMRRLVSSATLAEVLGIEYPKIKNCLIDHGEP